MLVRVQKEVRSVTEEASIILEDMYVVINRILAEIQTLKFLLGGSEGNEKHIIGKWKKGNPCYIVAESLTEL